MCDITTLTGSGDGNNLCGVTGWVGTNFCRCYGSLDADA